MNSWRNPKDLKEAMEAYQTKLGTMDETRLRKEANDTIWLSAYASNNSKSDYHWQVDMVYDECKRRDRLDIYTEEHRKLSRGG